MLRYITSCLLGVMVAPSGVVEAGGGGWRRRFEGGRSKARGQVNGSRGTRPDNGVLCEDGKFDGESLSSPSPSRTSHCPFNTSREWGEEDGASVHSGPGALGPLTEPCFRAP